MTEKIRATIEGILFAAGDPVEIEALASGLELSFEEAEAALLSLQEEYEENGRGIRLLRLENAFQMTTDPEVFPALIRLVSRPKRYRLTEVLLETLSIIAYKQPITRAEIERIRGVSSAHAVERLTEYGLIEEAGRLQTPGRPMTYKTTDEFLRHFPIESLENLPDIDLAEEAQIRRDVQDEVGVYTDDAAPETENGKNGET